MNILKYVGIAVLGGVLVFAGFLVKEPITIVEEVPVETVGALTGPDIPYPYFSFGGVRRFAGSTTSLTQATTTVCAIQSPAATSTLVGGGIRLQVSSTTASTVTIAKATTPYATTTLINSSSVSANAQATILAASTSVSALSQTDRTFAPNQYLVVGMAGGSGTFSPTGVCHATWEAF